PICGGPERIAGPPVLFTLTSISGGADAPGREKYQAPSGSLGVQRRVELGADGVDGANTVDTRTGDRRTRLLQVAVKSDEGFRLFVIDLQALADGVLPVVIALYQGLATEVIATLVARRIVIHVVDTARSGMHPAPTQALDDLVVRDMDLHDVVDRNAGVDQGLSLRNGAGKAVEQEALRAVRACDAVLHQGDDDVIGHQAAAFHDGLHLAAQFTALLHRGTQHVSGGNLGDAVLLSEILGLRALAGTGCTQKNDPHIIVSVAFAPDHGAMVLRVMSPVDGGSVKKESTLHKCKVADKQGADCRLQVSPPPCAPLALTSCQWRSSVSSPASSMARPCSRSLASTARKRRSNLRLASRRLVSGSL